MALVRLRQISWLSIYNNSVLRDQVDHCNVLDYFCIAGTDSMCIIHKG